MEEMGQLYGNLPLRIFLADGDALTLDTDKLLEILLWIRTLFPACQRVTIYGTAGDVIKKSLSELITLREADSPWFTWEQSGSDEILKHIKKGLRRDHMILGGSNVERSRNRTVSHF